MALKHRPAVEVMIDIGRVEMPQVKHIVLVHDVLTESKGEAIKDPELEAVSHQHLELHISAASFTGAGVGLEEHVRPVIGEGVAEQNKSEEVGVVVVVPDHEVTTVSVPPFHPVSRKREIPVITFRWLL